MKDDYVFKRLQKGTEIVRENKKKKGTGRVRKYRKV